MKEITIKITCDDNDYKLTYEIKGLSKIEVVGLLQVAYLELIERYKADSRLEPINQ